jgi:hypothetical protein
MLISTQMNSKICKMWAPSKWRFFSWFIIQNRVWTSCRIQQRGWPNCGNSPLICNRAPKSVAHMLFTCQFTSRIWVMVKAWIDLPSFGPTDFAAFQDTSALVRCIFFMLIPEWWKLWCHLPCSLLGIQWAQH